MTLYGLRLYEKVRLFSKPIDRNKIGSILPVVWHYTNALLKVENVLYNGCPHPHENKKSINATRPHKYQEAGYIVFPACTVLLGTDSSTVRCFCIDSNVFLDEL